MSACPRCQHPLVHGSHEGWTAWGCRNCGGIWLDIATARSLVAPLTDLGISTDPNAAKLLCPVCGQVMGPRFSPTAGVEIDECPAHGAWFDHQELVRVSQAVAQLRGAPPTPAQNRFANWGPPAAAGVAGAAVGVAAGAAAVGMASGLGAQDDPHRNESSFADAPDAIVEGVDTSFTLAEGAGEVASEAGSALVDAGAGAAELASGAAEGAFSVLEGVFAVVGGIFEGL